MGWRFVFTWGVKAGQQHRCAARGARISRRGVVGCNATAQVKKDPRAGGGQGVFAYWRL